MNKTFQKERDYTKMNVIMEALGCSGSEGKYVHNKLIGSLNLRNIANDDILENIANQFMNIGYESCLREFRNFLGLQ